MLPNPTDHARIYTDFSGLNTLQSAAAKDTPEARRETAQQFEALFIQMLLKNMRQASEGDDLLGGPQVEMSRDMYDKQLSIELAKGGALGIGELMLDKMGVPDDNNKKNSIDTPRDIRPEGNNTSLPPTVQPITLNTQTRTSNALAEKIQPHVSDFKTPEDFIHKLRSSAESAARQLGTEPEAILAIAALETGWGQHVILGTNGASSHNLFGIKANKDWDKNHVTATTLEFENGIMQIRQEAFRQYASVEDSVQNFADFLIENPRYQKALDTIDEPRHFIEELHKAGYATDPDYTHKVLSVMDDIKAITQETVLLADK